MEDVKTLDNIKKYFDLSWDEKKSLPLATSNGPFGTMTIVQSDDCPVAAHAIQDLLLHTTPRAPWLSLLEMSCFSCQARLIRNPRQIEPSLS
jgi:hypothetical protein